MARGEKAAREEGVPDPLQEGTDVPPLPPREHSTEAPSMEGIPGITRSAGRSSEDD